MNTAEYMAAVKRRLGIESDYALAKALGVTRQTVSRYSTGKGYFDDEVAMRVAAILDKEAGIVMLDMMIERSKTPELRAAWQSVVEKISASFRNLLLGAGPHAA